MTSKIYYDLRRKLITLIWLLNNLGFINLLIFFIKIIFSKNKTVKIDFLHKGQRVIVYLNALSEDLSLLAEIFTFKEYELPFAINPKIIIDGGANKGVSVLYFALTYPKAKIYAFEPNNELLPALKKNIRVNKVNAEIIPKALDAKSGMAFFYKSKNHLGSKLTNTNTHLKVNTVNLEDFCLKKKIKTIDLLKLDIEGKELAVLQSLKKIKVKAFISENHYDKYKQYFEILAETKRLNLKIFAPRAQDRILNPTYQHSLYIIGKVTEDLL